MVPSQSRSHAKRTTKGQTRREDTPDPTPTPTPAPAPAPTPDAAPLGMVGSDGHAAAVEDENEVADDLDAQSQGSDASWLRMPTLPV